MRLWKLIKRLMINRLTLARAMGEMELTQSMKTVIGGQPISAVLVAGGGRRSSSTELILTGALDSSIRLIHVDIDHTKLPDLKADLTARWPFKDETFSLVMSTWVVEHLSRPEKFFEEAFRVLKNDGVLICGVPFIYQIHGSPSDYWRFTDAALSSITDFVGFRSIEIKRVGGTPLIACVSLLWPFLKLRVVGILLFLIASTIDSMIVLACNMSGKGKRLLGAYPIHFIAFSRK